MNKKKGRRRNEGREEGKTLLINEVRINPFPGNSNLLNKYLLCSLSTYFFHASPIITLVIFCLDCIGLLNTVQEHARTRKNSFVV